MARYFTRPKANRYAPLECEDEWRTDPLLPQISVNDHEATDTGLIDHRGDPIMRGPNPMGFVWR